MLCGESNKKTIKQEQMKHFLITMTEKLTSLHILSITLKKNNNIRQRNPSFGNFHISYAFVSK